MNHSFVFRLHFAVWAIMLLSLDATTSYSQFIRTGKVIYRIHIDGQPDAGSDPVILEYSRGIATYYSSIASGKLIPSSPVETNYILYDSSYYLQSAKLSSGDTIHSVTLFSKLPASEPVDETVTILGYTCKKLKTVVRSNTIEIWYTEQAGIQGTPWSTGK